LVEKNIEKSSDWYEKVNGSLVAYFGFIFSVTFLTVAAMLYSNSESMFSLLTTYISDLGAASRNSSLVFAIGMIISAPVRVVFGLYLLKYLESKAGSNKTLKNTAKAIYIGAIGSIALAVFPHDVFRIGHMLGSFVYFFSVVIIQVNVSRLELRMKNIPKYLPVLGITVVVSYVMFLTFEISELIFEGFRYVAIALEWFAYFALMAWLVMHGYYIQKSK
jgi:hypothetical membrane protein